MCSSKSKHRVTTGSNNCKFGHATKRIESRVSNCYLHTHVHSSIIHNDQKAEAFRVSIYRWMDKPNVVYKDNECLVAQWFQTLCDPMDCIVHGILQARILEWVAFPFSRGSSQPRDRTQVSRIVGRFFTSWAPREALVFRAKNEEMLHHRPEQYSYWLNYLGFLVGIKKTAVGVGRKLTLNNTRYKFL